jgi:hypothetical protein
MATASKGANRIIHFSLFELDLAAGELRRNGAKVRLQEQPLQILVTLIERQENDPLGIPIQDAMPRERQHSRVGGGALTRSPPSAAQTARADSRMQLSRRLRDPRCKRGN